MEAYSLLKVRHDSSVKTTCFMVCEKQLLTSDTVSIIPAYYYCLHQLQTLYYTRCPQQCQLAAVGQGKKLESASEGQYLEAKQNHCGQDHHEQDGDAQTTAVA